MKDVYFHGMKINTKRFIEGLRSKKMDSNTGEIKLFEDLTEDQKKVFIPIPNKFHRAAKICIEQKRPGWQSASKELKEWAKKQRRKKKAQDKKRKASKKRNR